MKKFFPCFLGILIGIVFSTILGVLLAAIGVFAFSDKIMDNGYDTVAVSWAAPSGQESPVIYQARVTANDENGDGQLEVRGIVYIGSGMYQHDMGIIGTAANLEDALRLYGKITWTTDALNIGGEGGLMASLSRAKLQSHR